MIGALVVRLPNKAARCLALSNMLFSNGLLVFLGRAVGLVVNLLKVGLLFLFEDDGVVSAAVLGSVALTSSSPVDGFTVLLFFGRKNGRGLSFAILPIPPEGRLRFGNNSDSFGLNLLFDLPLPPIVGFGLSKTFLGVLNSVVISSSSSPDSVVVAKSKSAVSGVSTNCASSVGLMSSFCLMMLKFVDNTEFVDIFEPSVGLGDRSRKRILIVGFLLAVLTLSVGGDPEEMLIVDVVVVLRL